MRKILGVTRRRKRGQRALVNRRGDGHDVHVFQNGLYHGGFSRRLERRGCCRGPRVPVTGRTVREELVEKALEEEFAELESWMSSKRRQKATEKLV